MNLKNWLIKLVKDYKLEKEIKNIIKVLDLKCRVNNFTDLHLNRKSDWMMISTFKLSEDFVRKFKNYICWKTYTKNPNITIDIIREFKDYIDWYTMSKYVKLSEEFIREFKGYVSWQVISSDKKLSEDFLNDFINLLSIYNIIKFQKLSPEFIRQNKDKFAIYDWKMICVYQKLSEKFIEEHKFYINWGLICKYQKLSPEFIEKHNLQNTIDDLKHKNTLYWSTEEKEKSIPSIYERDGDYVIGYKGIRSDRYSAYNFQYKYEVGQTYECHGDCNIGQVNSFGLSVWTEEKAKDYCGELVIKVKFHIDDLCAVVHNGDKIRVSKFIVLT